MKIASKRYVCPESGKDVFCKTCGETATHVKEELVAEGAAIPICTLHNVKMVPVEEALKPTRTESRKFAPGYHAV